MNKLILLFCLLLTFTTQSSFAVEGEEDDGGTYPDYKPVGRETLPVKEELKNFGGLYAAQWAVYLVTQQQTIKDRGSFDNWLHHPFSPRFDRDSFDYNIFKHTFTGNYYYLFYRSRGYNEKDAFFWTFMSSLALEFTIETVTENPSFQDIYITPVFGTVLGIGFDKTSRYFHSLDNWWGHGLGYLINPMTLIPDFARDKPGHVDAFTTPIIDNKKIGLTATYRF